MLYDPSREFLPASALEGGRCPETVRDALIDVLRKFESGDVQYIHRDDAGFLPRITSLPGFNMSVWTCGSIMCIGGWLEHVGVGRLPHDWKQRLPQLYRLCHPFDDNDLSQRWNDLTLSQACRAIRHYLITGDGEHAWDTG